ncbi:MAG TPA: acetyl-CoA carboxylase biotin carboxylase subunit [Chloroflexota bacterium]|nr:acetyl-CoA carboxylase biotin carboxylase subunit [Chloroflexota bacterium]
MFKKVLIANRGEIAVRVIRTCREMGIRTVAVYSEVDRLGLHVRMADEAYPIGPAPADESYLRIDKILDVAKRSGAEAVHPGYGFLSENPQFAAACEAAGVTFIGPSAQAMHLLGDKLAAKQTVAGVGVPLVPGTTEPVEDTNHLRAEAQRVGLPLLIKAAAGGGGKGIHEVHAPEELEPALQLSQGEAQAAFGDKRVFLERLVQRPRHVEVQILADQHGNCIHLGERECSIQRRHQKLIEESPSVAVTPTLRERMGAAAVAAAKAAGYTNAGTVEFLLDASGEFYFLEVNTRLQVEHPVTEWLTGLDLVREQLRIAAGEPLSIRQQDVAWRGAAIEARITAEDPDVGFLPFTGRVEHVIEPSGPGVRFDHMLYPGVEVTRYYDSLLGKLIVWAGDRDAAIARMSRALAELRILGLKTTIPFHAWAMEHKAFRNGELHTGFIDQHWRPGEGPKTDAALVALAAAAMQVRQGAALAAPAEENGHRELGSRWKAAARVAAGR